MRALLLLIVLLAPASASAQFIMTPESFTAVALPYVQPSLSQDVTITQGNSTGTVSTGDARVVGYRMYYWQVSRDEDWQDIFGGDGLSYSRIDPQFVYWFGSCAIVGCAEDLTTVSPRRGTEEDGWDYIDGFPVDGGLIFAKTPLGGFGGGVHLSAAIIDPPVEASGLLVVEGGPQLSHVFALEALPLAGLTTASYVYGYDISGGGFGSTAFKIRTDFVLMSPLEVFGANVGIGASYFWDSRSLKGEDLEADATFSGLSYGLTLGG